MLRSRNGQNTFISFIALILIIYFIVLPLLFAILCNVFGSISELINKLAELIPFGEGILHLSIEIVSAITSQTVSYQETQGYLTFSYVLGELTKSVFTIIIFELLNIILFKVMGLDGSRGRWNKLKKICVTVVDALVAACFAPLLIQFVFGQVSTLMANGQFANQIAGNVISCILYSIVTGGTIVFVYIVFGISLAKAIGFVLGKIVMLDFVRLLCSYLCILLILLFWYTGHYWMMLSGCAGLLGIALLLAGIEMMISPIFEI